MSADASPRHRPILLFSLILLCALIALPRLAAAESSERTFNIPSDEAVGALRLFAQQSGRQVLYSGSAVSGVRTQAVHGRFTPKAALIRLLGETHLDVVEDERTGALAIVARDRSPDPPDPDSQKPPDPTMTKRSLLGTLAGLLAVTPASAQTQPSRTSRAADGDEVLEMSVFEVSSERQHGYRAASSVTATGIGTTIANVPVNVGVVTSDFISDWGGVELREATKGVSGFNSDSQNTNRVWLRGFESSRILQDGFEIGYGMMTDGIDRIEVIKGPSAIFHGEVNPAGRGGGRDYGGSAVAR